MPNQKICTPQRKAEVIKMALERSPSYAARESGISPNTIKNWLYDERKKAEKAGSNLNTTLALRPAAKDAVVQQVVDKVTASVQDEVFDKSVSRYMQASEKLLGLIETSINTLSSILNKHDWGADVSVDWLDSITKALATAIDKYQIMTGGATAITEERRKSLHVIAKTDEYDAIFTRIGAGSETAAGAVHTGKPVDTIEADSKTG